MGNVDGSFTPGTSFGTGFASVWLTTGDLNRDGKPDLVCRVKTADEAMVKAGSTSGVLTGRTFSGQGIQGEDSIQIVP